MEVDCQEIQNGDIIYTFNYPDEITDEITVDTINNDVVLDVIEENIHNELRICYDGSMYLDGKKVPAEDSEVSNGITDEFTMTDSEDSFRQSSGEVTNWLTTSCPYGKKADYNYSAQLQK